MNSHADVLIVTVTKVESKAVFEVCKKVNGQAPEPRSVGGKMYHDLGVINDTKVFMVQSEMGSGGPGASQQTVQKGIDALAPSAIIMVGIAFGVDDQKQKIGDILVSQRLSLYELQRVGKNRRGRSQIIPRGDRPHASAWLLNRFNSADLYWEEDKAKVSFGLILSGEKLADNLEFRQQLLRFEPEAIGGEMEGAGLYVACHDQKVDWIMVKAICDWADGHKAQDKEARQQLAAHNAASFVLHALRQAPLKREGERREAIVLQLDSERAYRSSLPRQPYFFGREKELEIIADALLPDSRSWGVLVHGPGGIGKTELAVRAAHLAPAQVFPRKIFLSAKVRELTPAGERRLQDFLLPRFMALLSELARELEIEHIERIPEDSRASEVCRKLAANERTLLIIDNVETFEEEERNRLYRFLSRLPDNCKVIVTTRRGADIDMRLISLDKLAPKDAFKLIAELAKTNSRLARANSKMRQSLYETTQGNPLLIKWVAGQLGRKGSRCRTIAEANRLIESAPAGNSPLEYIFGDLLDTFTESETAVLAALTHFTEPARVEWIAELAGLARRTAQTALDDLTDRALLMRDKQAHIFFLPTLAATFLRNRCPEAVERTGGRLYDHTYALVMENGWRKFNRYPRLEGEWPKIVAALPLFLQGDNARLQTLSDALNNFLKFSGRWDERLSLCQKAEEKALAAGDFYNAGWRAYDVGWTYQIREQAENALACAARCEEYWRKSNAGAKEKAFALRLRGIGREIEENYPAATAAYQDALMLLRTIAPESEDVSLVLNDLAGAEKAAGDYAAAERDYREALRIAKKRGNREGVAAYTGNLAELQLERQNVDDAIVLARSALRSAEAVKCDELIGQGCTRLARALARKGPPQKGLRYAVRAVEVCSRLPLPKYLQDARTALKECGGSS